jgi:hypothetical protein
MPAPRTLADDTSLLTLWGEAVYYRGALSRDILSKLLAAEVEPFLTRIKDTLLGQLDNWAEEDAAQADCDGENYALDGTVERFAEDKIDDLRERNPGWKAQDAREASEFLLYFKTGRPYDVIKLALEAELKAIKTFPEQAGQEGSPGLQAYGPLFAGHLTTGEAALSRRAQAAAGTATHRVREIEKLIADFNDLRGRHYEALLGIARQNQRPRSWAEQFARKGAAPSGLDAAEARGRAKTLLGVLAARRLEVPDEARKRLLANRDASLFDLWTSRVASVASLAELFAES